MKTRLALRSRLWRDSGFTLVEMLISIALLVLVVLVVTGLVNSASTLIATGSKHISADTQARTVFDRMAVDFGKMLKRMDVDYYLKQDCPSCYPGHSYGHGQGKGQKGQSSNDQIVFFSQVPGFYPQSTQQSSLSLVAYRVNSVPTSANYNKLQRMGVGLLWNGVSNPTNYRQSGYTCPVFFLAPNYFVTGTATASGSGYYLGQNWAWPNAVGTADDPSYETIGPGVFRFEYYYLLKNGSLSENPFIDTTVRAVNGLSDVEAIVASIAVIDPQSRSLLVNGDPTEQNILDLAAQMYDFHTQNTHSPPLKGNDLETQWNSVITADVSSGAMPRAAISAIRIYTRYFDLNSL
jgi:prepilin-type N-terminal cleavage/methylation domain-containing protein